MTTFTEGRHACEGIVSEAEGFRSRDDLTIAINQTIVPGSVLGKVTATGQYATYDPSKSDGTQTAAALALYGCTTTSLTDTTSGLTRDCEFRLEAMMWKSGLTQPQIAAAIASLAVAGIIIR
jgi:hypothetical protein